MDKQTQKMSAIFVLLILVATGHYFTPTEGHLLHKVHIVLTKLYLLPPLLAAIWFGFRQCVLVTIIASAAYGLHILVDWKGNAYAQASEFSELVGIWIVALLAGYLFDRQRALQVSVAKAHEDTLAALVSALDLRERNTALHSRRVREYALLLGHEIGLGERDMQVLAFGSLLHDVGKIAVADRILLKEGPLTDDEWQEMRRHPEEGWRVLEGIEFLTQAAEIVRCHHEKFDGTGYPRQLTGQQIPLGARIFAVVDVYDALTTSRSYKEPLSHHHATEVICAGSGQHFDPEVVAAFLRIPISSWRTAAETASIAGTPTIAVPRSIATFSF